MKSIYRMIIFFMGIFVAMDFLWDEMDGRTRRKMCRKMKRMHRNATGTWNKMLISLK